MRLTPLLTLSLAALISMAFPPIAAWLHTGFLGLTIAAALTTIVHVTLGVVLVRALFNNEPYRGAKAALGTTALLAAASWATWSAVGWEQWAAGQALPIINIAGLPAPILTLVAVAGVATVELLLPRRRAS